MSENKPSINEDTNERLMDKFLKYMTGDQDDSNPYANHFADQFGKIKREICASNG